MDLKQKQAIADEWSQKHGAASIDVKNRDIWLYDGGLFSVESYKQNLKRMIGTKKLPNGMHECIFSEKKYPHTLYKASIWVEELDETIAYFQSMRRMLRKLGMNTSLSMGPKTKHAKTKPVRHN